MDTRTDQQKTDDLIQEYLEQLKLSSANDSVTEIQSRLRALQGASHTSRKVDDYLINMHEKLKLSF